MSNDRQSGDDDLLRRARELRDEFSNSNSSGRQSFISEYLSRNKTFARALDVFCTLKRWTGPVGSLIAWMAGLIGSYLKFAAFRREHGEYVIDEDGDLDFSSSRLLAVILLTGVGLFATHIVLSAAYFYATYFKEVVYVTGKQEIETGELYQFGGCTSLPCSTESDNGKFYLVETSLYFPTMLYPEENVFANVPQQDGACSVEGYGIYFRSLRWIYKSLQLYQHVVDVSCRPYTQDEIKRSVASGKIISD